MEDNRLARRHELEGKARKFRDKGLTFEAIASELDVTERTVRRWLKDSPLQADERTESQPDEDGWPEERKWPNWAPDDLKSKVDWPLELAESHLGTIHLAEELGNLCVPWFYRSMVELGERYGVKYGAEHEPRDDYFMALAGLPVLAYWLDSPECLEIAAMIEEHRPWEGKGVIRQGANRKTYARLAKPLAEKVKRRAFVVAGNNSMVAAMGSAIPKGQLPVAMLLSVLMGRVPMFDVRPKLLYRGLYVGHVFMAIFQYPKGGASDERPNYSTKHETKGLMDYHR